jgi:hypothetical protein
MKVLLLAALLALAPPQAVQNNVAGTDAANSANNGTIEGRVLRSDTKEPISNVLITLVKANPNATPLSADAAAGLASIQDLISSNPGLSQATIDSLATSREQALGLAPGTLSQTSQATVLTDAAGHFSFNDQPPGKYTIRAALDGYFGPPANGFPASNATKSVTVEARKPIPSADIFMSKGGIISGRLRDPNGQPASGITVSANRVTYSNGRPQWSAAFTKQTDDRGEYRIFWVAEGEYYVGITPRPVSAIPSSQDTWAKTFFPGVIDPTVATLLKVKDGGEIAGVDFSVQSKTGSGTFKITGRALNPLAVPNATTGVLDRSVSSFVLSPREPGILDSINPPAFQNALAVAARPNGEFEIRNVPPGSYDLIPYYMAPTPPPPPPTPPTPGAAPPLAPTPAQAVPFSSRRYSIGRARVDVRNADVDGINVEIERGTEIRGKVTTQGTANTPVEKIKINLHSLDTMPEAFATIAGAISVDSNGDFAVPDLPKAKYSLQITGLPESAFVADIRQGGTTIFDAGLVVGNPPGATIEIVIDSNGATVEGSVLGSDRKPFSNATVVLVPPSSHRQNSMMYKSTQTDEKGRFTMNGVPPGEYTMFAWESVPPTAWMNSEFLAKYQSHGHPMVVSANTRHDAEPELIPANIER